MNGKNLSRRHFIKISTTGAAVLAIHPGCINLIESPKYDPKDLPTRKYGSTGIEVPLIGIGCGSRFLKIKSDKESDELLNYAIDHGVYFWDTAANYDWDNKSSEVRLGRVLKHRRKEVWLSTKLSEREGSKALIQFERSLKRLQTDYLDELKIHAVAEEEGDIERITKKGGVYEVISKLKEEGVVKNIGFSGHSSAEAMTKLINICEFDTMLIAMNHFQNGEEEFEGKAVPTAAMKKMGVIAMKVVRPRETVKDISADDLIRYALSLEHVSFALLGIDSLDIMKKNIELIKGFKPFDNEKMRELRVALDPFYKNENVEWMNPSYKDGQWV